METPNGVPKAPGVPESMGAGVGVVDGRLPQTPGNQAQETPLQFSKPSSGGGLSIGIKSMVGKRAPGSALGSTSRSIPWNEA